MAARGEGVESIPYVSFVRCRGHIEICPNGKRGTKATVTLTAAGASHP